MNKTDVFENLSITIERISTEEYTNKNDNFFINYNFAETPFEEILIASTTKGICYIDFIDDHISATDMLFQKFPYAEFIMTSDRIQQNALLSFSLNKREMDIIRLHVMGTEFQIQVWRRLLEIPIGKTSTYGKIAAQIGNILACRAVGSAVGKNPVAFLIPCHRVVLSNGEIGNYKWGKELKAKIINWEKCNIQVDKLIS